MKNFVNVYGWAEYVPKEIITIFENEYNIKVKYNTYTNNEILHTKLNLAIDNYDVVFPSYQPFFTQQADHELLLKLDTSKLPNIKNIDPILKAKFNDKSEYGAVYSWGITGIYYNPALTNNMIISSWGDILNPEIMKKYYSCGISLLDAQEEVLGAAHLYYSDGKNTQDSISPKKYETILQKAFKYIKYFNSDYRYRNDIAKGNTCIAMGYSLEKEIIQLDGKSYTNDIKFVIPKEGGILWADMVAIPKNAKNIENAYKFINFLLRNDIMTMNAEENWYYGAPINIDYEMLKNSIVLNYDAYFIQNANDVWMNAMM